MGSGRAAGGLLEGSRWVAGCSVEAHFSVSYIINLSMQCAWTAEAFFSNYLRKMAGTKISALSAAFFSSVQSGISFVFLLVWLFIILPFIRFKQTSAAMATSAMAVQA